MSDLHSALLRLAQDMSKGFSALHVMIAERDAKIAINSERIDALRRTLDDARREQDTSRHDLTAVREAVKIAEAKERHVAESVKRGIGHAAAIVKIVGGVAGFVALLWQLYTR